MHRPAAANPQRARKIRNRPATHQNLFPRLSGACVDVNDFIAEKMETGEVFGRLRNLSYSSSEIRLLGIARFVP